MKHTPKKLYLLLIYVVLTLVTIIAFEQVRLNDFVNYDDNKYVTENPDVKAGITRESIWWALSTADIGYWHPLALLSHMLDCELFGLNPHWHHLTSLFIHVANTLLLFWVLKRMTGSVWASSFVAAVFAIHPSHVESVGWISERKDVLSVFFLMLTMGAYVRYTERPGIGRYLLVSLCLCLGLMAKPMLVTLPFVLLLLDYWPLERLQWYGKSRVVELQERESAPVTYQRASPQRLIVEKIPLLSLVVVLSAVTYIVQQKAGALKGTEALSLNLRVANALVSYISYIGKIFYPHQLAVLYPHSRTGIPAWQPVGALLILVFVSVGVMYSAKRRHYLAVGWFWYLGTLVPVIGLVQAGSQSMADRYTYLSSIGIFIMVAWGAAEITAKWRYRKVALPIAAGLLLAVMLVFTRMQVRYWQNSLTLCGHALEVTENNCVMHNNYATALYDEGRFEEALAHFNEALRINPDYFDARRNIGNLFLKQEKYNEAIANLSKALHMGKEQAEVYRNLGFAYAQLGEHGLAIQHYNQALRIDPEDLRVRNSLGRSFLAHGKFREAIACFSEVLRTKTGLPDVYSNLGLAYYQLGDYGLAVKHWTEAVKLKPDFADVLNNLAWILAVTEDTKLHNPADAVKYAERACELTEYNRPGFLDSLAVAYAAVGNFPEAVKTAEKAVALALSLEREDLAAEIQKRLELYKVETVYYEQLH